MNNIRVYPALISRRVCSHHVDITSTEVGTFVMKIADPGTRARDGDVGPLSALRSWAWSVWRETGSRSPPVSDDHSVMITVSRVEAGVVKKIGMQCWPDGFSQRVNLPMVMWIHYSFIQRNNILDPEPGVWHWPPQFIICPRQTQNRNSSFSPTPSSFCDETKWGTIRTEP